jgi:hypothetical protein
MYVDLDATHLADEGVDVAEDARTELVRIIPKLVANDAEGVIAELCGCIIAGPGDAPAPVDEFRDDDSGVILLGDEKGNANLAFPSVEMEKTSPDEEVEPLPLSEVAVVEEESAGVVAGEPK